MTQRIDMAELIDPAAVDVVLADLMARAKGETLVADPDDTLGLLYQDMLDQAMYIATLRLKKR